MKVIHRVIKNEEQEQYVKFMENFDYLLLERFIEEKTTDLHLIKFNDKPYSKKLNKLEREYFSYEKISILPFVILSALAIIAVTTFLILFFVLGEQFDYSFWFLTLLLPVFSIVLLGVGLFTYKYFKIVKEPVKNKKRQEEILKEIELLKK